MLLEKASYAFDGLVFVTDSLPHLESRCRLVSDQNTSGKNIALRRVLVGLRPCLLVRSSIVYMTLD
jgi:hypothetical protein